MTQNMTYLIQKTIEKDPVIKQGLARNLISARSLASHIQKLNPKEDISPEALRTAIRRMQTEIDSFSLDNHNINRFIKDAKMSLKSGIVKVAFQKGDASLELINRGFKAMEIYGADTFRVTKGQKILHILVDEENLEKIREVFFERIVSIEKNVCEITVTLPETCYTQYGIWATFFNEIAINKINLVDAFSSTTEISIFVKEEDSQKTYNTLKDMIERIKQEEKEKKK